MKMLKTFYYKSPELTLVYVSVGVSHVRPGATNVQSIHIDLHMASLLMFALVLQLL